MARKLKVFSAQMGFVRAVVAAPSRKAALEAWGVRDDLFARGTAEEVTDPALVEEALASPGEVLQKPIASGAELISAAETKKAGRSAAEPTAPKSPASKTTAKPRPPPARDALDAAEAALKDAEAARRKALAEVEAEQAALDARREALEARLRKSVEALAKTRDREKAAYDKAFKTWGG